MADLKSSRLAYIDWMRGLACVVMFQTHCYDAWLSPAARQSSFFAWSQLLGTLPAPLFLFLAGISFAFAADKFERRAAPRQRIASSQIGRGAELLGLGLLFRLQEYLIAFPWAPWTDLFRVDILNTIGVSIMLMGAVCWIWGFGPDRTRSPKIAVAHWSLAGAALVVAALISLLAPLVWTSWRPTWLPWPLESYIDGVHIFGTPQAYLFPIFPWTAFAFVGLAAGVVLLRARALGNESFIFLCAAAAGIVLVEAGRWLDSRPQIYPVSDFWRTSPNFFLIRVGILLLVLSASYLWCRKGLGQRGFAPFIALGQTSLLVYWVHIEFVYGRLSLLKKHGMSAARASIGLLTIFLAMLLLSVLRVRLKGKAPEIWPWARMPGSTGKQAASR
jgi:uncharacterized membrane protein